MKRNRLNPGTPKEAHLLAAAIGRDAANSQMRHAGRTRWNRVDANLAAETMGEMYSIFGILNAWQWMPEGWVWAKNAEGDWQPRVRP